MTAQPVTNNLATIPNLKPLRHRWYERTPTPIREETTGLEKHERVCELCKITRTTVIPPRGRVWIEWEWPDGKKQIEGRTPPCDPVSAEVVAM